MPARRDTVLQQPPRSTNQPSFAHKKKKRGGGKKDSPVRQEERIVARPQRKVDEDEVRRDSPDIMVCSWDSDAHACRDKRVRPYCRYWRCEGKKASKRSRICCASCGAERAVWKCGF